MTKTRLSLLAATALLGAAPAWAATLYTLPAATGALATSTAVTADFSAGAGAGLIDFTLAGYATLDGDNFYVDILHVTLNGHEVFSGTWDLGGGGANRVLFNPNGATVGPVANQQLTISLPVTLAAGTNHLVFSYESPTSFEGSGRAGFQDLGDEGWGLKAAAVTGAVPEPTSGALLLAGLGLTGWLAKRRRG
ncbi:PEP-CTERM sorting domain-containing protein [Roseateles sp. NT4]|uniref:PEP-CTERM sorting domain-containing protein n=1 Tax=Roseateles sp. NT4 TaxID=3453715 RepID=UPI003F724578